MSTVEEHGQNSVATPDSDALVVDESGWTHAQISGPDRVRFLQGMCTADIAKLATGSSVRATMLNAKGRVVAMFEAVAEPDRLVLICERDRGGETAELLSRYAIMDEVEISTIRLSVYRIWGSPGSVISAPAILGALPRDAAPEGQVEIRRVEGGLPRYGIDITEGNFPFETTLAQFISYDKGCYVGQEPVSRVYNRGQANKLMRGFRFAEAKHAISPGTRLSHTTRQDAGIVTSSVVSRRFGVIGLGYVHRTVSAPGESVLAGESAGEVVELPF